MTDDDVIARARYWDGQFLRVQDFQDEQEYHVRQQRRHNISGHTWGIVVGLEVSATHRAVQVSAGSAVDERGRGIVLAHAATKLLPTRGESFDVVIRYDEAETDQVDDECAGTGAYRMQELPRIELHEATDPPTASGTDLGPGQLPLDDGKPSWVFLGRVELDPLRPDDPPVVRLEARRYTGLVGVTVDAPSGSAALRFSGGPGRGGGPGVFEVLAQPPPDPAAGGDPVLTPVLTVSGAGLARLAGDLTVEGSLTLHGDELVFGALPAQTGSASALGIRAQADVAAAPEPSPWSVRQVSQPAPQLQIVLPAYDAAVGGTPASFAIGTWSKDHQSFVPALTVYADGNVEIPGTLRVGGLKNQAGDGPPPDGTIIDGGLDPEAQRMVTAAALSGVAGGSGLANALYRPETGSVQPAAQPPPQQDTATAGEEGPQQAEPGRGLAGVLADLLAADPTLRAELATQLAADHPETARALRTALPTRAPRKRQG
jgi:hypothetical protein